MNQSTGVARMVAFFMLIIVVAGTAAGVGGYNVIVQSKRQSEYNESLLRVVLAVSGCTTEDTPEACQQRQVDRAAAEGVQRIADVDCRFRRALARLPPPPPTEPCKEG
jgi:hypothetical protein